MIKLVLERRIGVSPDAVLKPSSIPKLFKQLIQQYYKECVTMNSIQTFRKAMGVAEHQTRLFQHQLYVDPDDTLAKKVTDQYVEALSTIHPTLAKAIAPQNIDAMLSCSSEHWQQAVEAGIQIALPGDSSNRPLSLIVVGEKTVSTPEQLAQVKELITRLAADSECWLIALGDTPPALLAELISAERLGNEATSSMALSTLLIPRVAQDGNLQIEEDLIQTAAHALLLPVLCDSNGDRFLEPDSCQAKDFQPVIVEATGVLGTKSRMVDKVVPSIIQQIIRSASTEKPMISIPSPISLLNHAVEGSLPFNATPLISSRSTNTHDYSVPCLYTSSQRFTISLFKAAESARIETVALRQRPQWVTEFASLVTEGRVDKLYGLIAERFDRHFEKSVKQLSSQLADQLLDESTLQQLGDKSRGLVATRQSVNVSSGDAIDIRQNLTGFSEAINERQRTILQSVFISILLAVVCLAAVVGAIRYAPMLWFWPPVLAMVAIGVMAIRCWVSHKKMLRLQEQVLESVQREAQTRLCSKLHHRMEDRFSKWEDQIKSGIDGLAQAGKSIRKTFALTMFDHAVTVSRFQDLPVSADLAESCHRWFVKSRELGDSSSTWSATTHEIIQAIGMLAFRGKSSHQVVNDLRREFSRFLMSKLPPADLWRALTRNEFSELDRTKLDEIWSHCNGTTAGQLATTASREFWIVPHSIRPHLKLDETPLISALPDRVVCVRLKNKDGLPCLPTRFSLLAP